VSKLPYFSRGFVRRWKAHLKKALTMPYDGWALFLVIASDQMEQNNPICAHKSLFRQGGSPEGTGGWITFDLTPSIGTFWGRRSLEHEL